TNRTDCYLKRVIRLLRIPATYKQDQPSRCGGKEDRHRRPDGGGKVNVAKSPAAILRPAVGLRKDRRRRYSRVRAKIFAPKNCHDSSASSCLPSHHSRKHRLRPTRRIYGRNRLCSPGGAGPRICRAASPKIRDCRE